MFPAIGLSCSIRDPHKLRNTWNHTLQFPMRGSIAEVADMFARQIRGNFMWSRSIFKWPKRTSGGRHKLLVKSGRLLWSAQWPVISLLHGGEQAMFTSEVGEYGVAHHYGSSKTVIVKSKKGPYQRRMNLPSRPFYIFSRAGEKRIGYVLLMRIINKMQHEGDVLD